MLSVYLLFEKKEEDSSQSLQRGLLTVGGLITAGAGGRLLFRHLKNRNQSDTDNSTTNNWAHNELVSRHNQYHQDIADKLDKFSKVNTSQEESEQMKILADRHRYIATHNQEADHDWYNDEYSRNYLRNNPNRVISIFDEPVINKSVRELERGLVSDHIPKISAWY